MWYIHHTFVCIKFLFRLSRFLTFYIIQLNHLVQETEVVARKSRKKVMLNPKPCRRGENGWTNEISRLKKGIGMMQAIIIYIYIYTHVIIYLIEVASRFAKLDTVWPLFDSFNLKMSKSAIWEGKCRPESLQRNTHSSKHLTSSKGHTSHEEKPLTFQYTGYLIIRDPNNGLLKYPPNWVVYGSIILYVPEKQPGALFFSASTYPQNP